MSVRGDDDGMRWAARPTLARGLRVAVFAAPVAAAVGVSSVAHLALGAAGSRVEQAWHLAVLVAISTATLVLVDRVARRALPLATLLELSLLFPDRAPSRFAIARDAVRNRTVEQQLARVREAGADPAVAAREILGLVAALRAHDRPTRGHAERVRVLTDLVAEAMNIPARDRDLLRWASLLHDIGKLRVSPAILNKPGKPTEEEWALLRAHPMHGAQIASALLPWLGEWGDVIVQHHERYDGTGYPSGLAGREISLGGRIVAVADAYEVMTATRTYQRPISRVAAQRELVKWSGRQFDPVVVRAMVGLSAPRLRRAQGVLAWLSDVPMVATSYVPAATVARVVGAGALATGVATGVGVPAAAFSSADAPAQAAVGAAHSFDAVSSSTPAPSPGSTAARRKAAGNGSPDRVAQPGHPADRPGGAANAGGGAEVPPVDATVPTVPTVPTVSNMADQGQPATASKSSSEPTSAAAAKKPKKAKPAKDPKPVKTASGKPAKSVKAAADTVTSAVDGTVSSAGTAVQGTVDAATSPLDGNVTGTVAGTVGTVTGTVGTVTGTVGTVTGTVTGTATDTVTGVLDGVGGLLGGGKKKK